MTDVLVQKLDQFQRDAHTKVSEAQNLDELQNLKVLFLGKKGELTQILKTLGQLSPDERKNVGRKANEVKQSLLDDFDQQESLLKQEAVNDSIRSESIDVTLPGLMPVCGTLHPVTRIMEQTKEIFRHLGFDIAEGPEIETDYYNFEALNIPQNHPARDMQDTFYLPDGRLLRTHTSPVQIHVMERQKPPIAMIAPGVVYRRDSDQTHTPMFHQVEGLLVDQGIHFGHLKGVVEEYLIRIFERDLKFRFRPSFFPFTEPSAEVDMTCVFCSGKGCRVCQSSGWLEIMGCGMVAPEVFRFVKIDARRYTGFAFGAGLERIAMLKFGIHDLRLFFENDVRFLEQF